MISSLEKQLNLIDQIMDNFDFHKVHRVMKMLNWKWAHSESESGVPEEYELRNFARNELNRVLAGVMDGHKEYQTSCGGFEAYAKRWSAEELDDGKPCIQLILRFVVADWDVDTSYDD